MASEKQIAANRQNSKKSTGPGNTTSSRFNATKHGLLAVGVTELDNVEGYPLLLAALMAEKKPVGVIETHRVECIALDIVRQRRAQRCEAEYITEQMNPPKFETDSTNPLFSVSGVTMVDPGLPASLRLEAMAALVRTFQRYEGFFAKDLSRNERDLEHSQQMRRSEKLPATPDTGIPLRAEKTGSTAVGPLECNPITTLSATLASPLPEANNGDEALSNAPPTESPEVPEALWQKPHSRPIWHR